MIHLFKTCMITAFILGLTWSAPLRAQDQRYISIRNTDTIWLPGNICAYQFRLDNGGHANHRRISGNGVRGKCRHNRNH